LTRDAELYIDDEFAGDLISKIRKGLQKRSTGVPCRFLYDKGMPKNFLRFLKEALFLSKDDLFPGGKYHNFSDLFTFPNPGIKALNYSEMPPLKHKDFIKYRNVFDAVSEKDFFFHFPYQSYEHILSSLKTAAEDPDVKSIKITLYRIAKNSRVVHYLVKAAHRGKDVTAFVEIKARFDEEINLISAEEMQRAGVKVLYSLPGLKVHAKMCLISRIENAEIKNYGYLATGNFNEVTARIYSDWGFFTADQRLTSEMEKVFVHLEGNKITPEFEHLPVAQFNMRKVFTGLIDNEIQMAKEGRKASIILKLNSIQDEKIISKLYEASNAGVKISMIVRGICCLKPGVKGLSENIEIISIIDRFLEHGRIFIFYNGGYEKVFVSSADWMKRNLSRRIETAFPIYDENIKQEIKDIIRIQFKDNTKARIIDKKQENRYKRTPDMIKHRAQYDTYEYLKFKD
jgi:polyphosphate kinase